MAFDYENYYRLEYLESSGTQYIIIDYKPGSTTNLSCTFIPSSYAVVGTTTQNRIFGSDDTAWNDKAFELYSWDGKWQVNWGTQTDETARKIDATNTPFHVCKITIENTGVVIFSVDGGSFFTFTLAAQSGAWSSPNNMAVFGRNRTSTGVDPCIAPLKILEFVIDGTAYTPAQRISDSVLGLYDEVTGTFYTNAGTGTFIAGPIIVASPVSMEKGISIPATVSTDNTTYYTTQSTAFTGLGYPSAAVSTSTVSVPSNNGAQSWTGTKNEFTGTGTCTGFDDEGFVNEGAAVTVTGLNAMIPAGMGIAKAVVADIAYNAVWNDIVDCIEVPDDTELEYGRAYCFNGEKFYFSTKYLDDGYIGIHSDTAGMFMGNKQVNKQLRVASAGFVLAYVDKTYPPGTPLTVAENGTLTKLKEEDIEKNPHKLVGTFWKDEPLLWWGFDLAWSDNLLVEVKGRKWIKVK